MSSTTASTGPRSSRSSSRSAMSSQKPSSTQGTPNPKKSLSQTNSTTSHDAHKSSITSGTAAGIGVGSAVAGAILAMLILWIFMRKPQRTRRSKPGSVEMTILNEDLRGKSSFSPEPDRPTTKVLDRATAGYSLPQPSGDHAIDGELSRLGTLIKNYVQSYYLTAAPDMEIDKVGQAAMEALGQDLPVMIPTLAKLLSNQSTRIRAIRFCVAWMLTSKIELNCDPDSTFLPPEISSCMGSMSIFEDGQPGPNSGHLLSEWRSLSAHLLKKTYDQQTFSHTDRRRHNIEKALQALDKILYPYANHNLDNDERLNKLEEILKRGARFGFLLFRQPSLWRFDWDMAAGTMIIFPGLLQIQDENGQIIVRPRVLSGGKEVVSGLMDAM